MKRWMPLVLLALLPACKGGDDTALRAQVQALETENATLRTENTQLKAQVGRQAASANDSAVAEAARSYARRCVLALEIQRTNDADFRVPATLDGKACDDPALGHDAQARGFGIASSRITVQGGGSGYSVAVQDSLGRTVTQTNE